MKEYVVHFSGDIIVKANNADEAEIIAESELNLIDGEYDIDYVETDYLEDNYND